MVPSFLVVDLKIGTDTVNCQGPEVSSWFPLYDPFPSFPLLIKRDGPFSHLLKFSLLYFLFILNFIALYTLMAPPFLASPAFPFYTSQLLPQFLKFFLLYSPFTPVNHESNKPFCSPSKAFWSSKMPFPRHTQIFSFRSLLSCYMSSEKLEEDLCPDVEDDFLDGIEADTNILLKGLCSFNPQDEEVSIDPYQRDIPDVTIFLLGSNYHPPRKTLEKLFSIPKFNLKDVIDSFSLSDNRIELFLLSLKLLPQALSALRNIGPLLGFLSKSRGIKIQATSEFRFFRISLWGLSARNPKNCLQGFLVEYPHFPSDPRLVKIKISEKEFAPGTGGSALLYYSSAPIEFYSGKLPLSFRLKDCRIKWGIAKAPKYLSRHCRFCSNAHPTHLCYLPKAFPEKYPLTDEEAAQDPLVLDRHAKEVDYLEGYSSRLDLFNCFEEESGESSVILSPSSVDSLKGLYSTIGPSSSSSNTPLPVVDPEIENFLNSISTPIPAGSKRKHASAKQGHNNHNVS